MSNDIWHKYDAHSVNSLGRPPERLSNRPIPSPTIALTFLLISGFMVVHATFYIYTLFLFCFVFLAPPSTERQTLGILIALFAGRSIQEAFGLAQTALLSRAGAGVGESSARLRRGEAPQALGLRVAGDW